MKKLLIVLSVCTLVLSGCSNNEMNTTESLTLSEDISAKQYNDLKMEWDSMTIEKYVIRAAQQIWNVWPNSTQVWDGVDYSNISVVFVETNKKNAWLIEPNNKISRINPKELPSKYKAKGHPFMFTSSEELFNGVPTIKVEVDSKMFDREYSESEFDSLPTATMLFSFVSHEEFHHVQTSWRLDGTDQEKLSEDGQNNFIARSQRLEIVNALSKAVLYPEKEQEYLEAAKWWLEKYKRDNPEEYLLVRPLDVLEGSARYFDMAMSVRSLETIEKSKEEILMMYQEMILKDYTLDSSRFYGLADEESYELGGLSGIILEIKGNSDWKEAVEQGIPSHEFLLEDYKAVPQISSPEVVNLIEEIKAMREN